MSLFLLTLFACAPTGSVSLDDGTSAGQDLDGDGIPDDQQPEDEEPQAHFASGDWSGEMGLYIAEWDWDVCEGEISLEVDDEGAFTGASDCLYESDWGSEEFPVDLEGNIDEDGNIEGTVEVRIDWGGGGGGGGGQTVDGELSGDADEGGLVIEWVSEMDFGGGGGGGQSREVEGWADLSR